MTLLITAACNDFVLSVTDTRISVQRGNRFVPYDERFNKHVYFALEKDKGVITYTGVAQWGGKGGKGIRLYDLITDSLVESAKKSHRIGTALVQLTIDLSDKLSQFHTQFEQGTARLDLHVAGYVDEFREPFLAYITTGHTLPEWNEDETQWEFPAAEPFRVHFSIRGRPTLLLGGLTSTVLNAEELKANELIAKPGIDAFDVANYSRLLIARASRRNDGVGPRAYAFVIPSIGSVDTAMWDEGDDNLKLFMPRVVMPNGQVWDTSEIDVELWLALHGQLQKHSLLFKSIIHNRVKKRHRRLKYNVRKGAKIPTTFELIGSCLFGGKWEGNDYI